MFHYKSRRIRIFTFLIFHCESFLTRRNVASPYFHPPPFSPLVLFSHATNREPPSLSNSPKVYNNFNRFQRCTLYRALEFLAGNKAIKPFGTHVGHWNFVWPIEERLRSNGKQISVKFEFEGKGASFPSLYQETPFLLHTVRSSMFSICVSIQREKIRHVESNLSL